MLDKSRGRDGQQPGARRGPEVPVAIPPDPSRNRRLALVATVALAVVVAVVLLLVPALRTGSGDRQRAGSAGTSASCDNSKGRLVIGMVAPLSGGLSALGLGMSHAADLAVVQANARCAVPGYQLAFQAEDDQSIPQFAAQAGTKLAADPAVVGVVGTFNSSTAQALQPVLHDRSIVMVSPANTSPVLTLGDNPTEAPKRPFPNYFRVSTTDLVQGPFAARYLIQKAGKKNIAVIDDGKTYGAGLAEQFAQEAQKLGAKVVAREIVGEKDTDFSGVIARIRVANPDAVYYGGEYPVGGRLSGQLAAAGLNIPLMGGDGLVNPQYVALGGRAGDLATNVGTPPEKLPSAKQFIADYQAAKYPDPYGAYGAFTYDATNVIIDALAETVRGGGWSDDKRATVVQTVQNTNLQGAGGRISFDAYGDNTNKVLTVYRVEGSDFLPVEGSTGAFAS
jgi:branched-chain amino acid transport system substrate-binding protein